jgi:hypothetical protein
VASPSRRVQRGQPVPTFEFSIVSDGETLGDVTYGICASCRTGLLYKIGFPTDWQFCGLGRLALRQLEARHPGLIWLHDRPVQTRHRLLRPVPPAQRQPLDRQAAPLPALHLTAKDGCDRDHPSARRRPWLT